MIGIVNYGMGNVGSIKNMLKKIGHASEICGNPKELGAYDKLVLPGVGAFDNAMAKLHAGGFSEKIVEFAASGKPILGICLGMQLLANSSEEGQLDGLGLVTGQVMKFNLGDEFKIPHMGWNTVRAFGDNPLLAKLEINKFYFVHSYHFAADNEQNAIGKTNYGLDFNCMVRKGNVYGAQFHPEKSHKYGMQLFKNFAAL